MNLIFLLATAAALISAQPPRAEIPNCLPGEILILPQEKCIPFDPLDIDTPPNPRRPQLWRI